MSLPPKYFSEERIESVENGCSTMNAFLQHHCTQSICTLDASGNPDCAICYSPFAHNPEYPVFGDVSDPNLRLVQTTDKCVHAFHVGCISESLASNGLCPMCRCAWYVDTLAQQHRDWIREFMNDLAAGRPTAPPVVQDGLINVSPEDLNELVLILAYALMTRGAHPGSRVLVAARTASSPDGHAMVEAIVRFIVSQDGKQRLKKELLVNGLCFETVSEMRRSGDDRPITAEMLTFMDVMSLLLWKTYDYFFTHLLDFD